MTLWFLLGFVLFLLLRSTIPFLNSPVFDLYHAFIIYLAVRMSYWKGFLFSVLCGYILGSLSPFPSGEYLFSFALLFAFTHFFASFLNMENRWTWFLLPAGGAFLNILSAAFIRKIAGHEYQIGSWILLQAVLTVCVVNVFRVIESRKNVGVSST